MIVLPLTPDPVFAPVALPRKEDQVQTVVKVLVLGFSSAERKLLDGVVAISGKRPVRIELLPLTAAASADVIMVDTANSHAVAWAAKQSGLARRAVVWVDGNGAGAAPSHTLVKRPVQWPNLSVLLNRALGQATAHPAH